MKAHFLLMFAVIRRGSGGPQRRMARNSDQLFETENTGGLLSGFLAEEDEFDRRSLWRLGSWAAASVGAVIVALYANQSSIGLRREQVAAADLARQSQQIQLLAKESQNEARRLAVGHRHAQRRSRPAVFPRHRSGAGPGFRDRFDRQAKLGTQPPAALLLAPSGRSPCHLLPPSRRPWRKIRRPPRRRLR